MSRRNHLLSRAHACVHMCVAAAEARVWTNKQGKKINAEFVEVVGLDIDNAVSRSSSLGALCIPFCFELVLLLYEKENDFDLNALSNSATGEFSIFILPFTFILVGSYY